MERMDMHLRDEYLKVMRKSYIKARSRKEKTEILDEYCRNTGQTRKYVITKIHKAGLRPKPLIEMELGQLQDEVKDELKDIYLRLNPTELKRNIDAKLSRLYEAYAMKGKIQQVNPYKKLSPHSVRFYMIQQPTVGLAS